jgi:hypothetical protein
MKTTKTRLWRRSWILLAVLIPFMVMSLALAQPPYGPFGPAGPGAGMPRGPGGFGPWGPRGPFGRDEEVWVFTCTRCNRIVGTGKSKNDIHNFKSCPHCGVVFSNTYEGMKERNRKASEIEQDKEGRWNERTNPTMPPRENQPGFEPPADNQPGFQPPAANQPGFQTPATPTISSPGPAAPPAKSSRGSVLVVVLIVGLVVLIGLVALAGGVIWMITTAPSMSGPQPVKVKRRRTHDYEPI